jgi:hypothetical protein
MTDDSLCSKRDIFTAANSVILHETGWDPFHQQGGDFSRHIGWGKFRHGGKNSSLEMGHGWKNSNIVRKIPTCMEINTGRGN